MAIQDAALQPGDEFKGKVALVTGATRNIGRSIALALAAGGAAVAVNARASREAGEKIVHEITAMGGQAASFISGQTLHVNGAQMMYWFDVFGQACLALALA